MASINGISLKNVKTFPDHEGCRIAGGDVWYNGKKLGHWQQDYYCGPDNYDFDERVLQKEVEAYKQSGLVEERFRDVAGLDSLLDDLLHLKERESVAKKYFKQGYRTVIFFSDGYHFTYLWTQKDKKSALDSDLFTETLAECRKTFFKDAKLEIAAYEAGKANFDITVGADGSGKE